MAYESFCLFCIVFQFNLFCVAFECVFRSLTFIMHLKTEIDLSYI
jgi:hypothetical protein